MTAIREVFIGRVSSTADPEERGRIRVICSALLGDEDTALPQWIPPICDWGWFYVPDVGELVDIEVIVADSDDGAPGAVSISQGDYRWRNRHWGNSEGPKPTPIPADFKGDHYGKRRGFATPAGHVLMFDDTPGSRKISLTCKVADKDEANPETLDEYCYFTLDAGDVIIANKKGSIFHLDAKNGKTALIDQHGNSISTGAGGIAVVDKGGNFFSCDGSSTVNVVAQGTVNLRCKNAVIDAGKIELGANATDALLKSSIVDVIFAAHQHTSTAPGNPTSPPIPPANTFLTAYSAKAFTG